MLRAQSAATFLPTTNLFYKVARLGEPLIQPCVITSKKATEQYDCFSEDINWPFESPDSDTRQGGGRKKRAVWLKNLMTKRFHLLQIIWVCFEAEWKTHTLNRPSSSAYCRGSFHLGDLFDTLMRNDSIEQVEGVFLGGGCVRVWFEDPWSGHAGCYWAHLFFVFFCYFKNWDSVQRCCIFSFLVFVLFCHGWVHLTHLPQKKYTQRKTTQLSDPKKTPNNPKSFNEVNYNKQQTRFFKLCRNKWSLQKRLLRCVVDLN